MNDLISRQAAIDICRAPHMRNADCSDFEMAIMMLPPAQPKRIKGRWIYNSPVTMKCERCGYVIKDWEWHKANYCAGCGTDMREEEE